MENNLLYISDELPHYETVIFEKHHQVVEI